MQKMHQEAQNNACLYVGFRDEQFALYDAYVKKHSLVMNTFLVLNALYYAKEGMSQKEITDAVHHSKQTVSLIVKKLVQKGYAVMKDNPRDGRNTIISLSQAGRRYAEVPVRHIRESEEQAMAMFSAEEQEQLTALSRKYTENLKRFINTEQEEA